jgi:hypothetical protein
MDAQAAAITVQGKNLVIVLMSMDIVTNSGEGDMAIDTLQAKFGSVPVVLMAQR